MRPNGGQSHEMQFRAARKEAIIARKIRNATDRSEKKLRAFSEKKVNMTGIFQVRKAVVNEVNEIVEQAEFRRISQPKSVEKYKPKNPEEVEADPIVSHGIEIQPHCAVCLNFISRPIQLNCKHVFCQGCVQSLPLNNGPVWQPQRACPMCRELIPIGFNYNVSQKIAVMFKKSIKDPEQRATIEFINAGNIRDRELKCRGMIAQ